MNNVIIVAGGKGLRMGIDLPKQFIPIGGKPILMHTIEAFYSYDPDINIILVLPSTHQVYWKELCYEYRFSIPYTIAYGGETRFHSVKNGLSLISEGLVAVHDGARPFASKELISRCFDAAKKYGAAIPVIDSTDSLREMVDKEKSKIIDRSKIKLVQTPQVFDTNVLKDAYQTGYNDTFTDDASVVEAINKDIHLVKGEVTNIKVTTPWDLKIGELILKS